MLATQEKVGVDQHLINQMVADALAEDIGTGDITAQLVPDEPVTAEVITREPCVLCGQAWAERAFLALDPQIQITWQHQDGDVCRGGTPLLKISGQSRAILTAERVALNFLQTLSGTATTVKAYTDLLAGSPCQILDTRKTIPLWRQAQKYAVRCGGGVNHRMGLYDAFLIKENHIAACGSIGSAVAAARQVKQQVLVEVEVENLNDLQAAMAAGADRIMLDNFTESDIAEAVAMTAGRVPLEVSGNVDLTTVAHYARLGVDYISIGALTKHVRAIDLSLRLGNVPKSCQ